MLQAKILIFFYWQEYDPLTLTQTMESTACGKRPQLKLNPIQEEDDQSETTIYIINQKYIILLLTQVSYPSIVEMSTSKFNSI